MDSRPLGFPVILLNPIVSSLAEVKFSISEQKNLHRYLTRDQTADILNNNFYILLTVHLI
jgi:hypothetical protein